jgi:multidrug transporter EmrE-like cation transporter
MMGYIYIFGCLLLTVYGQMIVKWQLASSGSFPADATGKLLFLLRLLFNPWIMSSIAAACVAMLCWMAAMTRFELSYAYPLMSLAFVCVLGLSVVSFMNRLRAFKLVGLALIVAGIIVGSRW